MRNNLFEYIVQEIKSIPKPNNPNQFYEFKDLETNIELLFKLLDEKIEESNNLRVGTCKSKGLVIRSL